MYTPAIGNFHRRSFDCEVERVKKQKTTTIRAFPRNGMIRYRQKKTSCLTRSSPLLDLLDLLPRRRPSSCWRRSPRRSSCRRPLLSDKNTLAWTVA